MYIERKCWEGSLTFRTDDDDDDDDFDEFQRCEAILASFFGEKNITLRSQVLEVTTLASQN